MVRKEYLIEIKKDPLRLKKLKESRKRYREKIKKDPVRHAHALKMHKKHEKDRRLRNIDKERELARKRYYNMTKEEKLEYKRKIKICRINRRKRFITNWGGKCQKCGYSEHPEILEFDHKIPLYRITNDVKKLVSDHMLKEVREHPEKFELLCPNCHRIKTHEEITKLWEKKNKSKLDNLQ